MNSAQHQTFRIASLDGWRAFAITLVLVSHAKYATLVETPLFDRASWLSVLEHQGNLGVRIFFVLSGFLITNLLLDEAKQTGAIDATSFYIRRALRLLPIYYLFLLLVAIAQFAGYYSDKPSSWLGALTYSRNLIGDGRSVSVHFWSLAVEEQFYLLWPAILISLRLYRRTWLGVALLSTVAMFAFAARFWAGSSQGTSFVHRFVLHERSLVLFADCLAIGCIGGIAYKRVNSWMNPARAGWITYGSVAGLLASVWLRPQGALATATVVEVQALFTIVALIGSSLASDSMLFRILNSYPAVQIGALSYSLYVWHFLFLTHFTGERFPTASLPSSLWWVCSLSVAALSFYVLERPFLKLRRIVSRRSHRTPAQTPTLLASYAQSSISA